MEIKQLLGLDVGSARTGIARASSVARIAEPLATVKTGELVSELKKLIKSHSIDAVVVGLPRNLRGEDTAQTDWVRQWVDKAKPKLKIQLYWQDEALTSKAAEERIKSHKNAASSDALAAAIILQDFLDTPEVERVVC